MHVAKKESQPSDIISEADFGVLLHGTFFPFLVPLASSHKRAASALRLPGAAAAAISAPWHPNTADLILDFPLARARKPRIFEPRRAPTARHSWKHVAHSRFPAPTVGPPFYSAAPPLPRLLPDLRLPPLVYKPQYSFYPTTFQPLILPPRSARTSYSRPAPAPC